MRQRRPAAMSTLTVILAAVLGASLAAALLIGRALRLLGNLDRDDHN